MRSDRVVEAYLEKIAHGQSEYISDLLLHLADEILYTPVITIENAGDEKGTNRIKVASFSSEGRKIVPTFTSEEYFIEWSDGKHQCFSVSGADLALSLPDNTWLVLNPGHAASCELSPAQVSVVAASDRMNGLGGFGYSELFQTEDRRATRTDLRAVNATASLTAGEHEPGVEAFGFVAEQACSELQEVLQNFAEVDEAYFEETLSGSAQAVLGLLTTKLDAETRFLLIDQIAEVSRKYYGGAGAIEVYDDLNVKSSSSWELFKTLTPFYSRGNAADEEGKKSELRANLVIERVRAASQYPEKEHETPEDKEEPASTWAELRRKSSKLFGALRSRE